MINLQGENIDPQNEKGNGRNENVNSSFFCFNKNIFCHFLLAQN
jgi:hypothetical protein